MTDLLGQRRVQGGVGNVTGQIGPPTGESLEYRFVERLAGPSNDLPRPIDQLLYRHVVTGDAHDRTIQQSPAFQPVQRAKSHLASQIAGNSKDHQ